MKKFLLAIIILAVLTAIAYFNIPRKPPDIAYLKPGAQALDFIVGMKNSTLYRLNDFIGKNIVIITFSNNNEGSVKFRGKVESALKSFISIKNNIVWFNVEKDDLHAVINEITGGNGLAYRALYSDIPKFYNFSSYPSLIVIDKKGMVNMVYTGYSPTMAVDVKKAVEEIMQ